jgi:hypothetical protein
MGAGECLDRIQKNITSNCDTRRNSGVEVLAWIYNRKDAIVTYDPTNKSKITSIANVATKQAYSITGIARGLNGGHSRVKDTTFGDSFTHRVNLYVFEVTAEDVENIDNMDDVFVVFERLNTPSDDGKFVARGVKYGLTVNSDEMDENENKGARVLELTSMEEGEEPYSSYTVLDSDAATTRDMLNATLTATP